MEQKKFHGVHPLKRYKLQQQEKETEETPYSTSLLPAKKRKESRDYSPPFHFPFNTTPENTKTTTCYLPAKKRVWALQPLFNSPEKKPILSLDLNLEYQHSPEKATPILSSISQKEFELFSIVEEEEEEDDDDDGILCGVCQSTDGDPSDPIVFCDGCDLMVHAICYGDPLVQGIPEGDWFCATCEDKKSRVDDGEKEKVYSCCLCPEKGGIMKPTTDGKWAHVLCALFVPEVFFKNPDGRDGIDCSQVPKKRWEEVCYVCKSRNGCAIECSEPKCLLAFHVTCGLNEELCIEYKEGKNGKGGDIVAGFCRRHTEIWKKEQQTGKFKIVAREEAKK
ncbi:hypothetical protein IFM89_028657 [Coptis chinensis]|uniref:Protein Jade-1 n=1 Tax=Coptis chinensis TaxID=261450 RepID=A0A835LBX1_9MAGN|nr:hypothetical protein IFM89_028657 [Coptis chinensis]